MPVPRRRLLAGVAAAFAIYIVLLLVANTTELLQQLALFPAWLLLPLLLIKPLSWGCRFLVWNHFLRVVGIGERVSTLNSLRLYLAGFTMAVSPGKSAEVLKALVLRRWTGLPLNRGIPVVLAERVVETLSVLLLAMVSLLSGAVALGPGPARSLMIMAAILLATGLLFLQSEKARSLSLRLLSRLPRSKRIRDWLDGLLGGSSELLRPRQLARVLLPGLLATLGDALVLLVILSGFELQFSKDLLFQSLLIVSLTPLIGALSGLPNGAGITELSVTAMLLTLVAPQHPSITVSGAAAIALIESFFHKWLRVLVGLLVALACRQQLFGENVAARGGAAGMQERASDLEG